MKWGRTAGLLAGTAFLGGLGALLALGPGRALLPGPVQCPAPAVGAFEVRQVIPRSYVSYTQGLLFDSSGRMYESAGLEGESRVMRVDPTRGEVLAQAALPREEFGEGLALAQGELFQLTWVSEKVHVYDPETLALKRTLSRPGEGWGLAFDGDSLVVSDGSERLDFVDPATFRVRRTLEVKDDQGPVRSLNELEQTPEGILAHIYPTPRLVRIDPSTGCVTRQWDLLPLHDPEELAMRAEYEVVNGIARQPGTGLYWLTGKHWKRFLVVDLK